MKAPILLMPDIILMRSSIDIFAMARTVADAGLIVLMVEQNAHGALLASDRAIVLELGRKFIEGPAAEIMHDPRIRHAYLGGNIAADAPQ